ncbi:unnamed protein product [Gadus morhua 'NCC']
MVKAEQALRVGSVWLLNAIHRLREREAPGGSALGLIGSARASQGGGWADRRAGWPTVPALAREPGPVRCGEGCRLEGGYDGGAGGGSVKRCRCCARGPWSGWGRQRRRPARVVRERPPARRAGCGARPGGVGSAGEAPTVRRRGEGVGDAGRVAGGSFATCEAAGAERLGVWPRRAWWVGRGAGRRLCSREAHRAGRCWGRRATREAQPTGGVWLGARREKPWGCTAGRLGAAEKALGWLRARAAGPGRRPPVSGWLAACGWRPRQGRGGRWVGGEGERPRGVQGARVGRVQQKISSAVEGPGAAQVRRSGGAVWRLEPGACGGRLGCCAVQRGEAGGAAGVWAFQTRESLRGSRERDAWRSVCALRTPGTQPAGSAVSSCRRL